ncbi:MAG: hypothetical protein ACJ780_01225 [Solirubrobacteraceae bacterium]
MSVSRILVVAAVVIVGVVSFVFVRSHQGDGGLLVASQRDAQLLGPPAVERVVKAAPDPSRRARARSAACTPGGGGELHNPWRCTVAYPPGKHIRWLVTISLDGSYVGTHQVVTYRGHTQASPGSITGCCIAVP